MGGKGGSSSIRILLLIITAIILKLAMPTFGVELTWPQAITATILAQMFAFMFNGITTNQSVNIGIVKTKEDDEE